MLETILTTVLSSALFVTSAAFAPQATAPEVPLTKVLPVQNYVAYTVDSDESLAAISKKYYGSEEYWTNLWNDNGWIVDPENVEKGKTLKVRAYVPLQTAELETVLADREAAIVEQKNKEYLQQIGYLAAESVQPTVTVAPTQVPAAVSTGASPISEEAITYLGNCEAGNDPAKNTGNGYYGAFQFSPGTWNSLNTGYARADLAPIEVQRAAVKQLLSRSSIYNQFPGCARKMSSAGLI